MNIDVKNQSVVRIIRLVFGLLGIVAFAMSKDPVFALIGVLLVQGVLNTSCGIGGCGYPQYKKIKEQEVKEINFEEIK
ncbi:MAG TPA: hypothetical protein VK202_09965 [Bacteroidia bacterium]|nr:hypothetical protein [Bacteroidia bacterium]